MGFHNAMEEREKGGKFWKVGEKEKERNDIWMKERGSEEEIIRR